MFLKRRLWSHPGATKRRTPLIGHADACRDRFAVLQQQVQAAATQQCSGSGQPDWQVLVRRFRSLRATLVSHADLSLFAAQVYLLSTDVSLHAADHAECLKSLQALVQQLLPALFTEATRSDEVTSQSAQQPAQIEQVFKDAAGRAANANLLSHTDTEAEPDWGRQSVFTTAVASDTPCTQSTTDPRLERVLSTSAVSSNAEMMGKAVAADILLSLWADCAGLLILYFACIPQGKQGLELVSICRGLPGDILSRQPVKQAITAYSTLTRGDVGRFFKLHRKANWRQKRLMQVKLLQVQAHGLEVLGAAHRQLQSSDVQRMLVLPQANACGSLLSLLETLKARGNQHAAAALSSVQSGKRQLVFR